MPSVHDPEEQAGAEARPEEPDQSLEAAPRPWWQRRRYQVAVAFGVAAAVGTTGVLVAQHVGAVHHDVASETRAGGTSADPRDDGPEARAGAAKPGKAGARAPGKKGGHGPDAASPSPSSLIADRPEVTVTNSGSMPTDHHTLRVVSALADLSGQRELAWAADSGHPVGSARCTQNFKFGEESRVGERPTMLLCWRTSANKSVYTVAVDIDHRPSEQASTTTIDSVWSKLR